MSTFEGPCPCGSLSYATCCRPRHDSSEPAPTVEALMRSRYSAFSLKLTDYLVATHTHVTTAVERAQLERSLQDSQWLDLKVLEVARGTAADETGEVEFIARCLEGDQLLTLRERSSFVRREGRWLYDDGQPSVEVVKVGRNAPCPCGSGKKLKACHR